MSYKNPVIPNLTLKGIDKKIQDLQLLIDSSLTWVEKSFGLADRIVETKDERDFIYPAAFETNVKDSIPLLPGDAWSAYSFWVKTGTVTISNDTNFPPRRPILKYEVSCIFYVDIRRISPTAQYKESKSKLTEDIFHFFNDVKFAGQLVATKFIDDDITKVFDGFTLDQIDNRFKMYPKWACRMDFELYFKDDCYTTNTYA
jgi:hypothetical protein